MWQAVLAVVGHQHAQPVAAYVPSSRAAEAAPVRIELPALPAESESPATPVLPGLGVVGAGHTVGNAVGKVAARRAAERRFLGGGDPRARAAGRTRREGGAPGLVIGPGTFIDPRHPAARRLLGHPENGPEEGRAS